VAIDPRLAAPDGMDPAPAKPIDGRIRRDGIELHWIELQLFRNETYPMDGMKIEVALREKMLSLTLACPRGKHLAKCPFLRLSGLSYDSRKTLLAQMGREALLTLFDLAVCRCPADPRRGEA
jgi:hypothetical protein